MKFTKKTCGNGKAVWDAPRDGDEFLRITQVLSGQYALYHCYGLTENGITPLRSVERGRTDTLRACKVKAQAIYEKPATPPIMALNDYSHIRMPYKD